jgi:hypothetical protein
MGELPMMLKGYVSYEGPPKDPQKYSLDYQFESDPMKAMYWSTKDEAEATCIIYNDRSIVIPSPEGDKYRCTNFRVEQRTPNEFIVFCEAPFIPRV